MPNENQEKAVFGKYGLHKDSNDNGFRLIGLANTLNWQYKFSAQEYPFNYMEVTRWQNNIFN
jgi:hypothetical protein